MSTSLWDYPKDNGVWTYLRFYYETWADFRLHYQDHTAYWAPVAIGFVAAGLFLALIALRFFLASLLFCLIPRRGSEHFTVFWHSNFGKGHRPNSFYRAFILIMAMFSCAIFTVITRKVEINHIAFLANDPAVPTMRDVVEPFFNAGVIWGEFAFSCLFLSYVMLVYLQLSSWFEIFTSRPELLIVILTLPAGLLAPSMGYYYYGFEFFRVLIVLRELSVIKHFIQHVLSYFGINSRVAHSGWLFVRFLTIVMSVLFFTSAYIFVYENNYLKVGPFNTWFETVYFTVVTMCTVGYGDFAPATEMGKVFIIMLHFATLVLLPWITTTLAAMIIEMSDNLHYEGTDHIILCCKDSSSATFIRSHYALTGKMRPPLILLSQEEPPDTETVRLEKDLGNFTPFIGKASDVDKLHQVGLANASTTYIIADKFAEDSSFEDAANCMMAIQMTLINHKPDYQIYVQLLHPERSFVLRDYQRVQPIPLGAIQNHLLAFSTTCPGINSIFLSLLSNLQKTEQQRILRHSGKWTSMQKQTFRAWLNKLEEVDFSFFQGENFWDVSHALAAQNRPVLLLGIVNGEKYDLLPDANTVIQPGDRGIIIWKPAKKFKFKSTRRRINSEWKSAGGSGWAPPPYLTHKSPKAPSTPKSSKAELLLTTRRGLPGAASAVKMDAKISKLRNHILICTKDESQILYICQAFRRHLSPSQYKSEPLLFLIPQPLNNEKLLNKLHKKWKAYCAIGLPNDLLTLDTCGFSKAKCIVISSYYLPKSSSAELMDSVGIMSYQMCRMVNPNTFLTLTSLDNAHLLEKADGLFFNSHVAGGHIYSHSCIDQALASLASKTLFSTLEEMLTQGKYNFRSYPVPALPNSGNEWTWEHVINLFFSRGEVPLAISRRTDSLLGPTGNMERNYHFPTAREKQLQKFEKENESLRAALLQETKDVTYCIINPAPHIELRDTDCVLVMLRSTPEEQKQK